MVKVMLNNDKHLCFYKVRVSNRQTGETRSKPASFISL